MTRILNGAALSRNHGETPPRLRVQIYNNTYTLGSDGDGEYLKGLAELVDHRMREIARATSTVDSVKVAVLAALNIADELQRLKNQTEQADARLAEQSTQYARLLDGLLKPVNGVERFESPSSIPSGSNNL